MSALVRELMLRPKTGIKAPSRFASLREDDAEDDDGQITHCTTDSTNDPTLDLKPDAGDAGWPKPKLAAERTIAAPTTARRAEMPPGPKKKASWAPLPGIGARVLAPRVRLSTKESKSEDMAARAVAREERSRRAVA